MIHQFTYMLQALPTIFPLLTLLFRCFSPPFTLLHSCFLCHFLSSISAINSPSACFLLFYNLANHFKFLTSLFKIISSGSWWCNTFSHHFVKSLFSDTTWHCILNEWWLLLETFKFLKLSFSFTVLFLTVILFEIMSGIKRFTYLKHWFGLLSYTRFEFLVDRLWRLKLMFFLSWKSKSKFTMVFRTKKIRKHFFTWNLIDKYMCRKESCGEEMKSLDKYSIISLCHPGKKQYVGNFQLWDFHFVNCSTIFIHTMIAQDIIHIPQRRCRYRLIIRKSNQPGKHNTIFTYRFSFVQIHKILLYTHILLQGLNLHFPEALVKKLLL